METDDAVEKQRTVFPQQLAKRFAFRTVFTGPAAINQQITKPDISLATKIGHFHLLLTGSQVHRQVVKFTRQFIDCIGGL